LLSLYLRENVEGRPDDRILDVVAPVVVAKSIGRYLTSEEAGVQRRAIEFVRS